MRAWNDLVLSVLYRFDPETAHHLAIWSLSHGLAGNHAGDDDPILASELFDLSFSNPIGLAAGFDKDARAIGGALGLGFGFAEAGTVTPKPQPGNPKPRLFRLDQDEAVINRFGFNSEGLDAFLDRLRDYRMSGRSRGIVGANVGKNRATEDAAADYVAGIEALAPYADYLVVNLSSPNTPGLRQLQAKEAMMALVSRVTAARDRAAAGAARPPLLAKVGPDLTESEIFDIAEIALASGLDGLIIGNTTVTRPEGLKSSHRGEAGGLSGKPLKTLANECLARMYKACGGRLPIIGCGGVASGADAYEKLRCGASLVQLYSALVFSGPPLVRTIKRDLAALLRRDGFHSVSEAVGTSVD